MPGSERLIEFGSVRSEAPGRLFKIPQVAS